MKGFNSFAFLFGFDQEVGLYRQASSVEFPILQPQQVGQLQAQQKMIDRMTKLPSAIAQKYKSIRSALSDAALQSREKEAAEKPAKPI